MRRNLKVLFVAVAGLVGGCGMFSAHSDVIEEASGQKFTAQRFSELLTSIKGQPIAFDTKVGTFVTNIWTDLTLFSQAVANNKLTADSALVADAMWPTIQQAIAGRWVDTVATRRSKVTDAMVDSAYKADSLRAVQHILVMVDSAAPKEDKAAARAKIDRFLARVKGGGNFSQLAFDSTNDTGSKADSGWYPLSPRKQWDKPFGDALWALKPGEISGVVSGHYGYHIVRRPTDAESRKLWRDQLVQVGKKQIEDAYIEELAGANNVKVDGSAPAHMRTSLDDLDSHETDKTTLASYKDGRFTTADFIKWIRALSADPQNGPSVVENIRAFKDSQLVDMAKSMTRLSLVVREADKNNIRLTADEWKQMVTAFGAAIDTLKTNLGLTDSVLDPKASTHDRSRAAAERIDQYFNELVAQKAPPLKPLPGFLGATLRARAKPKFNAAALQHGLDLAKAKHAADSVAADKAGTVSPPAAPPGAVQPAPGGPPVGGAPPPAAPPKKP